MSVPRNRRERRKARQVRKIAPVRRWKRAFKGIATPRDVIANANHRGY